MVNNFLGTFMYQGKHNGKMYYKHIKTEEGDNRTDCYLYYSSMATYAGWYIGPALEDEFIHALSPLALAG